MVTKKRTKKGTGGTAAEKTAAKTSKKTATEKPKKEAVQKGSHDINALFNQLANLKAKKDNIQQREDEVKEAIKKSGFDEKEITTTKGHTFIRVEQNNHEIHKPGIVKALGKDTFIKYAKISASDIKKAIGDAGLQNLVDKGTVKKKEPTVYFKMKKK